MKTKLLLLFIAIFFAAFVNAQSTPASWCGAGYPTACTAFDWLPDSTGNIVINSAQHPCVETPLTLTNPVVLAGTGSRFYLNSTMTVPKITVTGVSSMTMRLCYGSVLTVDSLIITQNSISGGAVQQPGNMPLSTQACVHVLQYLKCSGNQFVPNSVKICVAPGAVVVGTFYNFTPGTILYNCNSCIQALPIRLESMSAAMSEAGAVIKWNVSTSGSSIIASYDIERMQNGGYFEKIQNLPGTAKEWVDLGTPAGKVFYRLAIHEIDGNTTYSAAQPVYNANPEHMAIQLNNSLFSLSAGFTKQAPATIDIYDLSMRKVSSVQQPINSPIILSDIPRSMYIIRVSQGSKIETIKVVL